MSIPDDAALLRALSSDRTPKFLATLDVAGAPNCVPVTTIQAYDGLKTLVFGEFFMQKTRRNLLQNPRVAIAVMDDAFRSWRIRGRFLGFQKTGDWVEFINRMPMFRYNAYTSIRAAGGVQVEDIAEAAAHGKAALTFHFLRASAAALLLRDGDPARPCMPGRVQEKFRRLGAVRAAAWPATDDYPQVCCLMACIAAGTDRLILADPLFDVCAADILPGTALAVAVITPEPVAYQVKGTYTGRRLGVNILDCAECYSASPPLLGERLDHRQ